MLTHAILLAIAVLTCIGIAKIEKSNKLFWMLLVSMLVGYASAGILSAIDTHKDKKQCVIGVDNSTQTPTCSFQAMLAEGDGTFIEIKSVGKSVNYTEDMYSTDTCSHAQTTDMQNLFLAYDTS